MIKKSFLGFNNPQSHGHKAKQLCSASLILKVNSLQTVQDRVFRGVSHMKKLKNIILGICDLVEKYVNYLDKQVKSTMEHHKTTVAPESPNENFSIRKIKIKDSSSDVWNKHFLNLINILTETDAYVHI